MLVYFVSTCAGLVSLNKHISICKVWILRIKYLQIFYITRIDVYYSLAIELRRDGSKEFRVSHKFLE